MVTIAGRSQKGGSRLVQMDHDYMLLFLWLCQWLRQWQCLSWGERVSSVFFELQQGMALIKHLATQEERLGARQHPLWSNRGNAKQPDVSVTVNCLEKVPPHFTKPIKAVNKLHHILTSDMQCSWTELSSWDEQFTVSITFPLSLLE